MNILRRVFLTEAFLFATAVLLGIAVALRLEKILVYASSGVEREAFNIGILFFYFITATLLIVFISKRKSKFFFRLIMIFSVFVGGWLSLLVFFEEYSFLLILLLVFLLVVKPLVIVHNTSIIVAIAGAGAVVGSSLDPLTVAVFAGALSVYDIIAVYKTKHMVEMAKGMIEARSVLGIIIPFELKDMFANLKKTSLDGRFLILGGGDITVPLLLCASFVSQGVGYALFIFFFSLAGLLFSFLLFISPKIKRPIPALPPIVFAVLIGFIFLEIFNHIGFL